MDEIITKLLTTVSTLTASVDRLEAAVAKQSGITERVVAAQETAIEQMKSGGVAGTARKPRATKTEAEPAAATTGKAAEPAPTKTTHPLLAAPNAEKTAVKNAKTGAMEDAPTGNYRAADFGRDEVKNEFMGWIGETTDPEVRKERGGFVKSISDHFGVGLPFHPTEGLVEEDHRKQALYFLRRKREGLKVDFSHDYDFDGDPLADQTADAASDDGMDALG